MLCHWAVPTLCLLALLSQFYIVGAVQLTQETPCLQNQLCLLKCVLESNSGIFVYAIGANRSSTAVSCTPQSCTSLFPMYYNITRVSNSLSYLEILKFADFDANQWSCSDGPNGQVTFINVSRNTVPEGSLTFGTTPCRMVSPARLTCSLPTPGSPSATLTIADSGSQTVNSSQTGSVTGTVTRGGQASCSVTWSAFPSFPLNISPVLCDVLVPAKAIITSAQPGTSVRVTCEAYGGYPAASVFGDWTHAWEGRVLRTIPAQAQNNQAMLTLTSFQDTGTYTCSVSNGVDGFKSNSTNVTAEDFPQLLLTSDLAVQAAEVNESVVLFSTLYSVPNITNSTWSFNSTPIRDSSGGFQPGISPATVSLTVYDSRVAVPGLNASLAFRFKENYTGSYSLEACNRVGCRSVHIKLQETGPPHAPLITGATATSDSVTLTWVPGFAGGDFFQWFHLKYRRQDGSEERWVDEARQQNRSSSERTPVTLTVAGLDPDTSYVFSLQAQNTKRERNRSSFVEWIITTGKASPSIGPVVGGVIGGVLGLALICVAVVIFLKYRKKRETSSDTSRSLTKRDFADLNRSNGEGKQNPALVGGDEGVPAARHSPHPILDEDTGAPPVYAVVDKKNIAKQNVKHPGSGAAPKSKGKSKDKSKGKATSSSKGPSSEKPAREVHADGTVYVTVEGAAAYAPKDRPNATKQPRNTKPTGLNTDDPVIYTTIDHSKKANES